MSPSANAEKLKANREYRAYRRTVDSAFVESEKPARKRYAKFSKLAREFAKKYPQQLEQFKREYGR
jgi:hypothetical protein